MDIVHVVIVIKKTQHRCKTVLKKYERQTAKQNCTVFTGSSI